MENEITGKIISAAIEVHKYLGPGLLESAYEMSLAKEFEIRGIQFERQKSIPLVYKNMTLDCGFRLDFIVENTVIIEIKAVESINPITKAQLFTYLRLIKCHLGLILNFNVPIMKNGIKRIKLSPLNCLS